MRVRSHLTFANVMSIVAVFIALGGSAFAAHEIAKIRKNSVGAKQLKDNSVASPEVRNGSLSAGDFAPGQLPQGERGPEGAQGPQGPAGTTGPAGPQGPAGTARAYATVQANASFVPDTKHPGFTDVFEPAGAPGTVDGINCLVPEPGIDVSEPASAVASPEGTWSGTRDSFVHTQTNVIACPPGTLEVRAYELEGNPPVSQLSGRVAFTVILP
jgi:hypothetical protein